MKRILLFAATTIIFALFSITSCKKDDEDKKDTTIKKEKITGFVQKGPFINGTQILMSELNTLLEQTGNIFTTQISNSRGSFEINDVQLSSSYVEFTASGFYFDEVRNDISSAQLTLHAISDITDQNSINVNILTHLEKRRVEYLVKENNYSFENAKQTAQAEVLAAFGITYENMQSSETLDISVNQEDNAILLAISLILQGNRSVGDLTELLALISSELREDGVIEDEEILNNLRASTLNLELSTIRQNLVERYQALNIQATIPDFESYIAVFFNHTPQPPSVNVKEATNITALTATLNGLVNPNSSLTTMTFEYGTTNNYGNFIIAVQSPVIGLSYLSVSASVSELPHNTKIYYRITAENEMGATSSNESNFSTQVGIASLTTNGITDVTANFATSGGNITDDGGASITARGVVYGPNPEPTLADNFTEDGSGIGLFTSALTGLTVNIHYYARAYATNGTGTYYGNEHSFFTFDCGSLLTDADNNTYNTILIGNQCWMKENLKTTKYRNGTSIENPTGISDWQNNTTGAYVWYDNDINWKDSYGALYNGYAVNNTNGLCSEGWHVPSDAEWTQLVDYAISQGFPNSNVTNGASNALKSCRQVNSPLGGDCNTTVYPRWEEDNWSGNNHHGFDVFGFSGLPSGSRPSLGIFHNIGLGGFWWSSTEGSPSVAWYRYLTYLSGSANRSNSNKASGFSVRCLRD